jgi:hypothetical protein
MTLKEKFKEILTAFWINDWEDECEKVADEFAVEFAIWLVERVAGEKGLVLQEGVLERFKKEKGL